MDSQDNIAPEDGTPSTETTVIPPRSSDHTHTVIFLHGREDFGEYLSSDFFDSKCSTGQSMAELFPTVRWVFPTAKLQYSAQRDFEFSNSSFAEALKGEEIISQWFDVWDIKTPEEKIHLMIPGLRDSVLKILEIVKQEASLISLDRVILGGISQGCAAATLALLASGVDLGGFIGLCSWLPLQRDIEAAVEGKPLMHQRVRELLGFPTTEDPIQKFAELADGSSDEASDKDDVALESLATLKNLTIESSFKTPVFLAHSEDDETVPFRQGKQLAQAVSGIGFNVTLKEYKDGGHWIHACHGVDDMAAFLRTIVV
ncbi:hypothetical protein QTJ16_005997 [Diplocarpon rosae]|uniref:Uncharacterized protein n=1 Tax=Diplocarpon rosae TaxID=946125 RepID=A0AAD9SXN6_9HELO|nr:hypothetical protein QTJ16_005997 [Diplocarpon rosae]